LKEFKQEIVKRLEMTTIRFADLFCGLGAFHHVIKKYGGECVFACDIDERVRNIYYQNYGIKPHGDINTIDAMEVPEHDLLCAGFPCQPFSIAGNKNGFKDKEKGSLFFKILDIIDAKHPQVVILENVKNIASIDNGNTLKHIVSELECREYSVSYKVLNSSLFGSPQCRERMFIVALQGGTPFTFPKGDPQNVRAVQDIVRDDNGANDEKLLQNYDIKKVNSHSQKHKSKLIYNLINKKTGKGGRQGERVYDVTHPGTTICASSGGPGSKTGLYKVNNVIRRLSVTECLGMFGLPDNYKYDVDDNRMLFYLGNSIVTNVIDAIINKLTVTYIN
jgi:DNA (cytosine-5)-methyltransferase 1